MHPVLIELGPFSLRFYGLMYAIGIVLAMVMLPREVRRKGLPLTDDDVASVVWLLVLGGIIGARLYYVAFEWDYYRAQPWSIPAFWEGGLAIHGGLLGGLLAGVWLARRHRIPLWRLGDTIAGALRVSYGPIFSGGWKQENVEYRDMPVRFCHGFRPPNRSRKKHVMHPLCPFPLFGYLL